VVLSPGINPTLNSGIPNPFPKRIPSYNVSLYAEVPGSLRRCAANYQRIKTQARRLSQGCVRYPCGHLSLANVLPGLTVVAAKA